MMTVGDYCAAISALPFSDPVRQIGSGRALILAPHPDDETLGCGGLIASLCAQGKPPVVAILTDGSGSHPHTRSFPAERLIRLRQDEARHATMLMGLPATSLKFFDYPDANLQSDGPPVDEILALIRSERCSALFAPDRHDPHCDHVATAALATIVAQRLSIPLWHYPVWTWMRNPDDIAMNEQISGWRLDISTFSSLKQRAIAAHRSQHGAAIPGLPDGFSLPPELLARFARPFEVFVAS
jgi:LmbE family N-acetylglucosaminyl deacetylase